MIIAIVIVLIIVDWFIFHDFLKGEHYTITEYLTGIVSIPIIIILGDFLIENKLK